MKNSILQLALLALLFSFTSCLDEDFDQPPTGGEDPNITVTTTIAELKAMHTPGGKEVIQEDLVIKGIVIADDASGNWYRTFVIQDETGGIEILTELRDSYVYYPRGREVYIKCKGLVMGDYNNLIQLGGFIAQDGTLGPVVEVSDFIIKGLKKDLPAPKVRKMDELSLADVSTLVTLEGVQFSSADIGATFADVVNQYALNRYLQDCELQEVIVRTSGYADFAGAAVPGGNGNFTGVLSVYRNDFQFLIRDLNDLALNGTRCDDGTNPCLNANPVTVTGVDEDFESGTNNNPVQLYGWTNIVVKGSRSWQFKEFSGNVYVQATAYNDAAAEMETWLVSPLIELTEPQVLTFETAKAFYTHNGLSAWISFDFVCDPLSATWQPLDADLAGQNDADNEWVPSGDVDLSSLVGQKFAIGFKYVGSGTSGNTGSFRIDNFKLGTGGGPVDPCAGNQPVVVDAIDEDFDAGTNNNAVALTGWTNYVAAGTRNWLYKEFSGDVYVQATAYNDTSPQMEAWLITPLIDVDGPKTLSFETAKAFWTHDGLSVFISTDFTCEPDAATWAPLQATLAVQNDADHAWIPSGDIDLSPYIGKKVAVGFRYKGSNSAGQTSSYRVNNLVVE